MPQAREVKSRIANIQDIKQITKAMNAIAMAKLTRLKNRLSEAEAYKEELDKDLQLLTSSLDDISTPLTTSRSSETIGVLVLNSDRGLCGRYKEELNRSTRDFIESREQPVQLYAGGEKGHGYFANWSQLEKSWENFYTEPSYQYARQIADYAVGRFEANEISEFWLVYMRFHSDLNQELRIDQMLPLELGESGDEKTGHDFVYEPEKSQLAPVFLRNYFEEQLFWALLNTKASEHAIRRKAMRDATDNANELIDDLTLAYNKARQQQITREIADIMGGAEALREE